MTMKAKCRKHRSIRQWTRLWISIAFFDALKAAFGWATIVNGAALAVLAQYLGFSLNAGNNWLYMICIAGVGYLTGVLIAFLINLLFVSHRKACFELKPLTLEVEEDYETKNLSRSDAAKGHEVAIRIFNRSARHILDTTVHVMNAPQADGLLGPRYVQKIDLPPMSFRVVPVAYWFSRELPNADDPSVNLHGPTAAGFGGNRASVPSDTILDIRVCAPDVPATYIRCRVEVDSKERLLLGHKYRARDVADAPQPGA